MSQPADPKISSTAATSPSGQSQPQPLSPDPTQSKLSRKLGTVKGYYAFLVCYLVLLSALGSFVNDMYTPALPGMCRFFGCSVPLAQMGLTMGMRGLPWGSSSWDRSATGMAASRCWHSPWPCLSSRQSPASFPQTYMCSTSAASSRVRELPEDISLPAQYPPMSIPVVHWPN